MSMTWLLRNEPEADRERIVDVLSGHLCRCTGYAPIVEAVAAAAAGETD
jgi:aerobic-type carbon monoxide dehydrogenase small subunit (CoxS/CutS family)